VRGSIAHLTKYFGHWRAVAITADQVVAYTRSRQKEGAASATVNRELAALKRAFTLAERSRKVAEIPYIAMLDESDNIREGFLTESDLDRLLTHLPPYLHAVVICAFFTGWRTASEILTRERRHLRDGWLILEVGEGKTRKPRQFPVNSIPRLKAALDEQVARVEAYGTRSGQNHSVAFHRHGRRAHQGFSQRVGIRLHQSGRAGCARA
jgi:hypothetical protein